MQISARAVAVTARVTAARYQQTGPDRLGVISAGAARPGAADISRAGQIDRPAVSQAGLNHGRPISAEPPAGWSDGHRRPRVAAQGGGPGWRPRVAAQGGRWPMKSPPARAARGSGVRVRVKGSGPAAQGSPDQTGGAIWQPLRVIGGGQAELIRNRSIGPTADLYGQSHRHPVGIGPSVICQVTRNHRHGYG